ncbi:YybH family protein [Streptacidiphilus pinicola]|nr:nuclear transport factor 2 family protein [Streptacidiphilus pinicola]
MTTLTTDSVVRDPGSLSSRFVADCNRGDLDGLLALYEPQAVVVEPTGSLREGTAAVRAHLARLLSLRPAMTLLATRTVVAGELALGTSHWRCDATGPDGAAIRMESHSAELSRRQPDGSWLMLVDNPWGAVLP